MQDRQIQCSRRKDLNAGVNVDKEMVKQSNTGTVPSVDLSEVLKQSSLWLDLIDPRSSSFLVDKPEAKSHSQSNPKEERGIWPLGLSLKSPGPPPEHATPPPPPTLKHEGGL